VVETRRAGQRVARDTSPESFSLQVGQADDFARASRAAAAYPAVAEGPQNQDANAFLEEARRLVTPPERRRK